MDAVERYSKYYGWLDNTKRIADFKAVPFDEVMNIGIIESLNILSLLKAKHDMEQAILKQQTYGK